MGFASAPNTALGFAASANTITFTENGANTITLGSVADSSFHAVQAYGDTGTASLISVDGVDGTPGNAGTQSFTSNLPRLSRAAGGSSLDGTMMEAGIWPSAFGSTNRGLMNGNIHGTNGYNF
ncbi:hypothetical protein GCM10010987_27950 [Bradyrhizobium guangdongense]|uniref:Uncharacterized protein n=2 Tax=Bradyrhizobium guangdongense TaxID=1325090 RepID=A0AA87W3C6_9BRAD|nr:hypothetical protein GCM10010987_27950 [Bradyrhizobium guangdongense]